MTTVGTFEAKTHLTQLLDRVAKGERIVITNRGKPVAMLVPPEPERQNVRQAVKEMRELRKGNVLGEDLTIRELIEEGRRS